MNMEGTMTLRELQVAMMEDGVIDAAEKFCFEQLDEWGNHPPGRLAYEHQPRTSDARSWFDQETVFMDEIPTGIDREAALGVYRVAYRRALWRGIRVVQKEWDALMAMNPESQDYEAALESLSEAGVAAIREGCDAA